MVLVLTSKTQQHKRADELEEHTHTRPGLIGFTKDIEIRGSDRKGKSSDFLKNAGDYILEQMTV